MGVGMGVKMGVGMGVRMRLGMGVGSDSWVWRRSEGGSRATTKARRGDETRGAQQPKLMHRDEVGESR